eukprot:gnl/MRDRNA2_/MRDRNA2_94876_c0_seq1.p1 gnl/MRDRNA2_/MRDRNA2_94876_c0~~gnl/MRDRNA2_/MRDRNA2_94876_c0_seq1.p1  ORF type:complete len:397 (-),score=53.22 gnl/MRDRNA2_/MRDRNA2_94876_c0_seq1:416-1606(-)
MCNIAVTAVSFVLIFSAQPHATEIHSNSQNLVVRAFRRASQYHADLDGTMLAKSAARPAQVPKLSSQQGHSLSRPLPKFGVEEASHSLRDVHDDFGTTGQTIGNGKYLLCKNPLRTPSGRSKIYRAYRSDSEGNPVGSQLVVKTSADADAMSREAKNYDRVTSGPFRGHFVKKIEFLPQMHAQPADRSLDSQCALVMEAGREDLKDILFHRGGLTGNALRDVASTAAQCVHAMHSSSMAWTDLKPENFIVMKDETSQINSRLEVKAIDVEGAIPFRGDPLMYTPESCPPEWASALAGKSDLSALKMDRSYDIWSYGMLLYELSTGHGYFSGRTQQAITRSLSSDNFEVDLSEVQDGMLRDLIQRCLTSNPRKRPSIIQVLLHPYFMKTGIGPHRLR